MINVGRILNKEVSAMCSDNFNSVLMRKSKISLEELDFGVIIKELERQAPTLLSLLNRCLKTKIPRINADLIVVMITGLICKHRRPSCSLIQRLISMILYINMQVTQLNRYIII